MDEDSTWNFSDLCCCECNYKAPTLHPHPTHMHLDQAGAQQDHADAPPRELMEQVSLLNQPGYKLQVVGPDGKVSELDIHAGIQAGHYHPPSPIHGAASTPVVAFQPSPMGSPRGHQSSHGLDDDQRPDRFTRDHYERMLYDHKMVSNYGRRLTIAGAANPIRILPPIPASSVRMLPSIPGSPGSPLPSRRSSLHANTSERHIRTIHPR